MWIFYCISDSLALAEICALRVLLVQDVTAHQSEEVFTKQAVNKTTLGRPKKKKKNIDMQKASCGKDQHICVFSYPSCYHFINDLPYHSLISLTYRCWTRLGMRASRRGWVGKMRRCQTLTSKKRPTPAFLEGIAARHST